MGNKLCKKKADTADNPKSPTPFDRIINRLHLRPNSWKSDPHLNQKQVNRYKINDASCQKDSVAKTQLLSKSSDWSDAALEVPDKDDAIHLRNFKLSLIFDNDDSTPTPPPRKHKKGLREKIEAAAKNGLQALQAKKPAEEPLCVKKTVKHTCPLDDHDCAIHNKNHEREQKPQDAERDVKQNKRRKNLSVVSLPNYNELKLSVATFDNVDRKPDTSATNNSLVSLPTEHKKLATTASTGKLETCMTRCRSFGSLLPQQLLEKLRVRKIPIDIESDDSFGGLEDWDLRILEHYNPKDASLPRQTKPVRTNNSVLSDIENLIVNDEETEKPEVPTRRSESLLKKTNREASEAAVERNSKELKKENAAPLPSPETRQKETRLAGTDQLPTGENGEIEHSTLMKILEEFSIRDKQQSLTENQTNSTDAEFKKQINSVDDFLHNEKLHTNKDKQLAIVGDVETAKT